MRFLKNLDSKGFAGKSSCSKIKIWVSPHWTLKVQSFPNLKSKRTLWQNWWRSLGSLVGYVIGDPVPF